MKPLARQTDGVCGGEECAADVLIVVPMVMRRIRNEMRSRRPTGLSTPQFRTLGYLYRRGGLMMSDVAEFAGTTLPTASKMISTLVKRGLVRRETSLSDRRCMLLELTEQGRRAYEIAESETQACLSEILGALSEDERQGIIGAMRSLQRSFGPSTQPAEEPSGEDRAQQGREE